MAELRTEQLEYHLPEALIATRPVEPRDSARLMVLKRSDPGFREHRRVSDLPEYLRAGDLMVFNTTKVMPARLAGVRVGTGGKVGGLYLRPGTGAGTWIVLLKAGHLKPGARIRLEKPGEEAGAALDGVVIELLRKIEDEPGAWEVRVEGEGRGESVLERVGLTPLPPYILQARKARGEAIADREDRRRYQTVYAGAAEAGSVAAPTAGLHFTPGLLEQMRAKGVGRADVVLHVGTGTFRPVEVEIVEQHPMHTEWCSMTASTLGVVREARERGRVFAVGTTSARTLESYAAWGAAHRGQLGQAAPASIETKILITPGHRWGLVQGMVTNFHLPRSTLLAMIAALLQPEGGREGAGLAHLLDAYRDAVAREYRFYSYGDAMLILP